MKASEQQWDKHLQILLVMIVGFNLIPHTLDIPPWVTAASVSCLLWKLLSLVRGWSLPKQRYLIGLTVLSTAGVFYSYRTLLGQEPASTLLVLLASLKLLETNRYRDGMLVILTSYFLLMAHLLNSQSLVSTIFMGLDVLLITTLMFQMHKKDRRTSPRSFRPAMKLLAIALPVWIFLFVVFPRFSTSLWQLQKPQALSTGFSDDLDPGSIENLVESEAPAFRVNFVKGDRPASSSLYWRGAILTVSHGLKWTKDANADLRSEHLITPDPSAHEAFQYQVFLEPMYQKWLFALDYPRDLSPDEPILARNLRRRPGLIYESEHALVTRAAYSGASTLQAPAQTLSESDRELYLQTPEDLTPRVRALAASLKEGTHSATEASRRILRYFVEQDFGYTRRPGSLPLGRDQLETFLFETRRGFCEHFASSYATLMRAMGYPARVTVGFQGGNYNQLGSYIVVRNLDAHAWAEIWQEGADHAGQGRWVRVDPTQVVAPLRLQLGGDFNRLDDATLAQGLTGDELRKNLDGGLWRLGLRLTMVWDAAQMKWNGFLLRYDFDYQKSLMDRIGLKNVSRWIFFLWVAVGVLLFIAALHWSLRRKAIKEDPVLIAWRKFCTRMEKSGIARINNEGPLAFAERAAKLRPDKQREIKEIAQVFVDLRYGPNHDGHPDPARIRSLRQLVRGFSIAPSSRSADS